VAGGQALGGGMLGCWDQAGSTYTACEGACGDGRVKMMLDGSMLQVVRAAGFECCRVWCVKAVLQGRA
jgi:hypothetical protein